MTDSLREEIHFLLAQLCRAIADASRVLILYTLMDGPISVSDLAKDIGLSQPSVSRHLRVLRESGLTSAERIGHSKMYRLADERVVEALDLLRSILIDNFENKGKLARTSSEST